MRKTRRRPTIPLEMREIDQWVVYRSERSEDGQRTSKVPYCSLTERASTTEPTHWLSYKQAKKLARQDGFAGVGFVFSSGDDFVGVDLDGCRDPSSGAIEPWASQIVEALDSYTEVSPSGTGVHIIVRGTLPPDIRHKRTIGEGRHGKKAAIEVYDRARYFTITGDVLGTNDSVRKRPKALKKLVQRYLAAERAESASGSAESPQIDEDVLGRARKLNPTLYHRLYVAGETKAGHSESESDFALTHLLVRAGARDPDQIKRLLMKSALVRSKWLERPDYMAALVSNALNDSSSSEPESTAEGRNLFRLDEILRDDTLMRPVVPLLPFTAWKGRVTLFYGREKHAGKSTFLAAGSAALSRGRPFLDHPTGKGRVLWVSADFEHAGDIARRFMLFDANPRRIEVLFPSLGKIEARLDEIEAAVAAQQPTLVVVDTLSNFARVDDPWGSKEWPEILLRIKRLASDNDLAVVLSHHTPKNNKGEYRDSTSIGGSVDQLTNVQNDADEMSRTRKLRTVGRLGVDDGEVEFEPENGIYRRVLVEASSNAKEAEILDVIRAQPGISKTTLRKAIGGRHEVTDKRLGDLIARGQVEQRDAPKGYAYFIGSDEGEDESDRFDLSDRDFGRVLADARAARFRKDSGRVH